MRVLTLVVFAAASVTGLGITNATFTDCLAESVESPRFRPQTIDLQFNETSHKISYQISGDMVGMVNDTSQDNTLASALTNTVSAAGFFQTRSEQRLCDVSFSPSQDLNVSSCPFGPGPVLLKFSTQLDASYMFASVTSTIRINGPFVDNYTVGCVAVTISPPLSTKLNNILTYIPLMILLVVGIKVVTVVILNPWSGTLDPFRGFSYFGLDPNALRMATPGFSDCLFYLQFIAYSSMLQLDYPGYFQLVTSRIGWAMLAFESSPITQNFDYIPQSSKNLATWVNFVGERRQDAWKSFMIWWLVLLACTVALVSLILLLWWSITPSSIELTRKNLPFLGGSILRSYYWFLTPLTIFTSYQLLSAQQAHAASVALSAIVFMALVVIAPICLLWFLPRHRPRQDLYDDLAVLNFVGPLYNTFSERAFLIFVVFLLLSVARGLTVGFLQAYGTAQIILLIIFEVIAVIALILWRPWPSRTNTTLLNIILTCTRFVIIMLQISFLPSLAVSTSRREIVGYVVLVLHAIVLVFLFLGNALLTLLELLIRLLVIVPQEEGARAIFGARQLRSRRRKKVPESRATVSEFLASANSMSGLLANKEGSPFFRAPRAPSRMSRGAETASIDYRSRSSLSMMQSPYDATAESVMDGKSQYITRTHSFASQEILNTKSRHSFIASAEDPDLFTTELALAPTEDAARRGVDYAVREADVYHPQSSGELLGPSKKLGTGPADPNGVVFRKIRWAPWRKEKNTEKGKFVVVRSTPAPDRSGSANEVPMQDFSPDSEPRSNPLSPQYESIQEEDEGEQHYFTNADNSHQDSFQQMGLRHVVNDTAPSLPALAVTSNDAYFSGPVTPKKPQRPTVNPSFQSSPPVMPLNQSPISHRTTNSVRSTPVRESVRDILIPHMAQSAQLFDTDNLSDIDLADLQDRRGE